MNATSPTRCLFLAVLLLGLVRPAHAQRSSPFMEEFRKLLAIHAQDEIAGLIKKHEAEAILAVIETCEAIANQSSDQLETEIDALNKAWRKAYNSKFVDIQYNYFSVELQGAFKKHRKDLIAAFLLKRKEFDGAAEKKELGKLPALGFEFQGFGDQFGELGDHYMAAQCYRTFAVCFDDGLNGNKADYKRACEGWRLYLAARDQIELRDKSYDEAKTRFEKLEFDGFGDPSKGPEARAAAKAAADTAYQPTPIQATFELVPDIEAIQRPQYTADTNFQMWAQVGLQKVDSSGRFPTMEDSPTVLRTGAAKAAVDVDGDGTGEVEIPLTGKITPVEILLGSGDSQRKWAFLAVIGQQQDTYQGFRFNLGPDDNQMNLYVAPAGSLVGLVNGVRVQVIDENLDGRYGSPTKDWAYIGVIDGSFQRDSDTVVVGESKVARPWSSLQKIGDAWFKLEPNENGTDLLASKVDIETGTLALDLKDLTASWITVRGTGNNSSLQFELVNGGTRKVEVPVGSYELLSGQVAQGKKAQMMKALMLPGKGSRSWRVGPGETTKVELGAPFSFDFSVKQDEATITVEGPSIVVTGRGGETYQRLWNCVVTPEVNLRKAGSTKGKKEAKLGPITSQEQLQDHANDYRVAWFPISTPLEKPAQGETFEAQLFEKKHKLFGKIESDWKAD